MSKSVNKTHSKRSIARLVAVQQTFQLYSQFEQSLPYESDTLLQAIDEKKMDRDLYEKILNGVKANIKEVDEIITTNAPQRSLDTMNGTNVAILRCAIYEAIVGKINPPFVVIDEYVEIAKLFGSESDSSFINGVLGKLVPDKND